MLLKLYALVLIIAKGRLLALSHKYNKGYSPGACYYIFDQTRAAKRRTGSEKEEKAGRITGKMKRNQLLSWLCPWKVFQNKYLIPLPNQMTYLLH